MRPRFDQFCSAGSTPEDIPRNILRTQIHHRLNPRSNAWPRPAARYPITGQYISMRQALGPSLVPVFTDNALLTNHPTQNHLITYRPPMLTRSSYAFPTYSGSTYCIPDYSSRANQMTTTKEKKAFEETQCVTASVVKSNSQSSGENSKSDCSFDYNRKKYAKSIGEQNFKNTVDHIIDMCYSNTSETDEKKYEIFKIPPPNKNKNISRKLSPPLREEHLKLSIGKTNGGQIREENQNLKRKSTDPDVLFDRGKSERNTVGIESLVQPKDDTEWKNSSMVETNTPTNCTPKKQCKSGVDGASCLKSGQQSANKRVVLKAKTSKQSYSSLDTFKDYTEWKNFMDYGTTSSARGSSNNAQVPLKLEHMHEKATKESPNDVIVIEDETEELRKEKFWSGQDKIKSCLGLHVHVPRPRLVSDDGLQKKKRKLDCRSQKDHGLCRVEDSIATSSSKQRINIHSQNDGKGEKQSAVKTTDGGDVDQNTSCLRRGISIAYHPSPKLADEAPSLVFDSSKDKEDVLRQMAIDLAQRPMSVEEADNIVGSLMREDVLNKPAEDVADFILELINKTAPERK